MAAWMSSLVMLRGSRPAASPSSPAGLNLVFDPGRSQRALGVRPQEEDVRPASLVPCEPTRSARRTWRARQSVHEMDFRVLGPVQVVAGSGPVELRDRPADRAPLLSADRRR